MVLDEAELPDCMLLANSWRYRDSRLDQTFAHLPTPARQHKGMDVERIGHILHLDTLDLAELHRLTVSLNTAVYRLIFLGPLKLAI